MTRSFFSRAVLRLAAYMNLPAIDALRYLPASMPRKGEGRRRISKYTPGGPNRNCGKFGISPKSWYRVNGKPIAKGA